MVAGLLGTGAATANAAQFGFRGGVVEGYIPPCPGEGYVWVAGYYDGDYWVPGTWVFQGYGYGGRAYVGFGGYRDGFRGGYGRDYGRGGYNDDRGFRSTRDHFNQPRYDARVENRGSFDNRGNERGFQGNGSNHFEASRGGNQGFQNHGAENHGSQNQGSQNQGGQSRGFESHGRR